jgi:hypothetical protein
MDLKQQKSEQKAIASASAASSAAAASARTTAVDLTSPFEKAAIIFRDDLAASRQPMSFVLSPRLFAKVFDLSNQLQRKEAQTIHRIFVQNASELATKHDDDFLKVIQLFVGPTLKAEEIRRRYEDANKKNTTDWANLQNNLLRLADETRTQFKSCKKAIPGDCKCYYVAAYYVLADGRIILIGQVYIFYSPNYHNIAIQGISSTVPFSWTKFLFPEANLPRLNDIMISCALQLGKLLNRVHIVVRPLERQKKILVQHFGFKKLANEFPSDDADVASRACEPLLDFTYFRPINSAMQMESAAAVSVPNVLRPRTKK